MARFNVTLSLFWVFTILVVQAARVTVKEILISLDEDQIEDYRFHIDFQEGARAFECWKYGSETYVGDNWFPFLLA